jgi:hypothetical protein
MDTIYISEGHSSAAASALSVVRRRPAAGAAPRTARLRVVADRDRRPRSSRGWAKHVRRLKAAQRANAA